MDWKDLELGCATPGFGSARRGYDRHEVDRFLGAASSDWPQTDAARDLGHLAVTRKLELVGKSTTHVLLAAEQEAEELLSQAEADIAELRQQAQDDARDVRAAADEYAAKTREEANAEASETIEEGLRHRARIDDEINELTHGATPPSSAWSSYGPSSRRRWMVSAPRRRPEPPANGAQAGARPGPKA